MQGIKYKPPAHMPAAVLVANQQLQALAVPAAAVRIASRLWRIWLIRKRRRRRPHKATAASQGTTHALLYNTVAFWHTAPYIWLITERLRQRSHKATAASQGAIYALCTVLLHCGTLHLTHGSLESVEWRRPCKVTAASQGATHALFDSIVA